MQKMLNWAGRGAVGEVRRRKKDEGRWTTETRKIEDKRLRSLEDEKIRRNGKEERYNSLSRS
jgi:hypothetical protein